MQGFCILFNIIVKTLFTGKSLEYCQIENQVQSEIPVSSSSSLQPIELNSNTQFNPSSSTTLPQYHGKPIEFHSDPQSNPSSSTTLPQYHGKWSTSDTVLLIRLVESNYNEFDEGLKKNVWIKIATELSKMTNKNLSPELCDVKWKGLKRTYKNIKDHNVGIFPHYGQFLGEKTRN